VLFRSRAQALMGRSDRSLGWNILAASVDVIDVPGHHDSCTKPPHVETLASRLAERLRRADVQ
jgi:thioesterase domain-containing protein